jgi:hypothetical protein
MSSGFVSWLFLQRLLTRKYLAVVLGNNVHVDAQITESACTVGLHVFV